MVRATSHSGRWKGNYKDSRKHYNAGCFVQCGQVRVSNRTLWY